MLLRQAVTGLVWITKRHHSPGGQCTRVGHRPWQADCWLGASCQGSLSWGDLCKTKPVQSHTVAVGIRSELVNSRTGLQNCICLKSQFRDTGS